MGGGGGGRGHGRLFEAGRLLTFSVFRMGAYSRWALIQGWALIRINTVFLMTRSHDALIHYLPIVNKGHLIIMKFKQNCL